MLDLVAAICNFIPTFEFLVVLSANRQINRIPKFVYDNSRKDDDDVATVVRSARRDGGRARWSRMEYEKEDKYLRLSTPNYFTYTSIFTNL